MRKPPRPQHRLWGRSSSVPAAAAAAARSSHQARARTDPFVVRNPYFPPLPAWAAAPLPRTVYLTYREASEIPKSVVRNIARLNPGWRVRLFGDLECLAYLEEHWPPEHAAHFRAIPDGPIRADFWRACIMYTHGGCYLDVDTIPKVPIDSLWEKGTDVCTSGSIGPELAADPMRHQWNPAILIARPRTHVMARTVGRLLASSNMPYMYWKGSITYALMAAASQESGRTMPSNTEGMYVTKAGEKIQLMSEVQHGQDETSRHTSWRGTPVMINHNGAIYDNETHTFRQAGGRPRRIPPSYAGKPGRLNDDANPRTSAPRAATARLLRAAGVNAASLFPASRWTTRQSSAAR